MLIFYCDKRITLGALITGYGCYITHHGINTQLIIVIMTNIRDILRPTPGGGGRGTNFRYI